MPDTSKMTRRHTLRSAQAPTRRVATNSRFVPDDRFYRHIVDSMRNGMIAIRRDGSVALMNDEAYRILVLKRRPDDIGRPFTEVLHERPDASRSLSDAFEQNHLSNRAEFRLKDIGRVVGYTLSLVRDDHGE